MRPHTCGRKCRPGFSKVLQHMIMPPHCHGNVLINGSLDKKGSQRTQVWPLRISPFACVHLAKKCISCTFKTSHVCERLKSGADRGAPLKGREGRVVLMDMVPDFQKHSVPNVSNTLWCLSQTRAPSKMYPSGVLSKSYCSQRGDPPPPHCLTSKGLWTRSLATCSKPANLQWKLEKFLPWQSMLSGMLYFNVSPRSTLSPRHKCSKNHFQTELGNLPVSRGFVNLSCTGGKGEEKALSTANSCDFLASLIISGVFC